MSHKNKHIVTGIICATIGFGIALVMRKYRGYVFRKFRKLNGNRDVNDTQIVIVNSVEECERIAKHIQRKCSHYRVLGFDCEWVTRNGKRQPIALMQLATSDDYCALIRLCLTKQISPNLQKLLEDNSIIKVGVAPADDARYLWQDYNLLVRGCVDLRHLAEISGGLSGMAEHYLGVEMDKSWRIRCSDWEAKELTERQVQYASQDSLVAVKIFNQLMQPWWQLWGLPKWPSVLQACQQYIDIRYKNKQSRQRVNRSNPQRPSKTTSRAYSTRQRPLYDNCILQAPDGELLSTCDHRKAEWYVSKNLGQVVETNPLTVRLTFEPSGRAVGEVGKYYTTEKENQCVVCGDTESYIRKNVVPHEYRKFFPTVMKDHVSHDILLLCRNCHMRNNSYDVTLRYQLAEECKAPIGTQEDVKVIEIPDFKKVKSAARALLSRDAPKIPLNRLQELEQIVRFHFGLGEDDILTLDMLREANDMIISEMNENYEPHGQRVVSHYAQNGGLMLLERRWREHFLTSMKPQYLPPLWSVTHNHSRLTQRIAQGRILPEELSIAGLSQ